MDKRKIRDILRLCGSIIFAWLYIPHLIIGAGSVVVKDVPSNCVVAGNPVRIIKVLE